MSVRLFALQAQPYGFLETSQQTGRIHPSKLSYQTYMIFLHANQGMNVSMSAQQLITLRLKKVMHP